MKLQELNSFNNNEIVLVEGRDDINEVILEMYRMNEAGMFAGAKKAVGMAAKGAKVAATGAGKIAAFVKTAAKKLQDTQPVQNFDTKIDKIIDNYKAKLGDNHKAVQMARGLGKIGQEHPKKTAFIIGVLSGLTSVLGTPALGMAVGGALRTAIGLAKGERASTALGKAATVGVVGSLVGMGASALADFFEGAGRLALDIKEAILGDEVMHLSGKFEATSTSQSVFNMSSVTWDHYIPADQVDEAQKLLNAWGDAGSIDAKKEVGYQIRAFFDQFTNDQKALQTAFQEAKASGENLKDITKALSTGVTAIAGGAAATKAEGTASKAVKQITKIAKSLNSQELAFVVSQIQRRVPA